MKKNSKHESLVCADAYFRMLSEVACRSRLVFDKDKGVVKIIPNVVIPFVLSMECGELSKLFVEKKIFFWMNYLSCFMMFYDATKEEFDSRKSFV